MSLYPYLSPYTKSCQGNQRPTFKTWSHEISRKKLGKTLHNICAYNNFFYKTPKAQATKRKLDKGNYIKFRRFFSAKEPTE